MTTGSITEAMRSLIGAHTAPRVSYPITDSDIRRWAIATYYPETAPQEFWDAEYAAGTSNGEILAPEEFNPFAWMVAKENPVAPEIDANDPDRTERLLGGDGPGLKFQLNGGAEVEYGARMRVGDSITEVTSLAEYFERPGKLGLMLFTLYDVTWTNQRGEFVRRLRQSLIRY